jgi:hypothetical protein
MSFIRLEELLKLQGSRSAQELKEFAEEDRGKKGMCWNKYGDCEAGEKCRCHDNE